MLVLMAGELQNKVRRRHRHRLQRRCVHRRFRQPLQAVHCCIFTINRSRGEFAFALNRRIVRQRVHRALHGLLVCMVRRWRHSQLSRSTKRWSSRHLLASFHSLICPTRRGIELELSDEEGAVVPFVIVGEPSVNLMQRFERKRGPLVADDTTIVSPVSPVSLPLAPSSASPPKKRPRTSYTSVSSSSSVASLSSRYVVERRSSYARFLVTTWMVSGCWQFHADPKQEETQTHHRHAAAAIVESTETRPHVAASAASFLVKMANEVTRHLGTARW